MQKHEIFLTHSEGSLHWSEKSSGPWHKVGPDSPSTEVRWGDTIDWIADETIEKLKIDLKGGKIVKSIRGNDSKKPEATIGDTEPGGKKNKYDIVYKAVSEKAEKIADPDIKVRIPPQ